MRRLLVLVAVLTFAVCSTAGAGPPPGLCRKLTRSQCEVTLGPYSAAQFLQVYVLDKRSREGGRSSASGLDLHCRDTKHHKPWTFRCGIVVGASTASPCVVDALISRNRSKAFYFDWKVESRACKTPS